MNDGAQMRIIRTSPPPLSTRLFSVWFRQYVAAQWPMALAAPEG
jgi:hypothetical protein